MSFLSKAYNFLKGKTSKNDENFYAKAKTPFPNEIYPSLCEPIDAKGMAESSWKNRRVLGEITNRTKSMFNDRELMKQKARIKPFSPRAAEKNCLEEKKINNQTQGRPNNKDFSLEGEEDEEEGVFAIQVRYPCDSLFRFSVVCCRMRKFSRIFSLFETQNNWIQSKLNKCFKLFWYNNFFDNESDFRRFEGSVQNKFYLIAYIFKANKKFW